eukprot:scaffold3417_cov150-Skeletonema_dohrnii-CCMP3373.AAC.1
MPSNNDPTTSKSDQASAADDELAGDNNIKKSSTAAKGAKPKPPPRRKGNRCSKKHKKNRSRNEKNSKRRVRNSNRPLNRPAIIPEARLVQAPLEYSFISDHEDEDEELEIQESIRRHVRVFSYWDNPECFNVVYRNSNNDDGMAFEYDDEDEGVN